MDESYTKRLQENLRLSQLELCIAYENEVAKWRGAANFLAGYLSAAGKHGGYVEPLSAKEFIAMALGEP